MATALGLVALAAAAIVAAPASAHPQIVPGFVYAYAGSGGMGYSGDGGPATVARLFLPNAIAFDSTGNLYVASSYWIRRVDTSGIITTYAGRECTIQTCDKGDGGPAQNATFRLVTGLAIDARDNLFIADGGAGRVRRVDAATGIISAFAGTGIQGYSGDGGPAASAQLNHPMRVSLDTNGNIYIADKFNHRIRRVSPDGIIQTVAGDGYQKFPYANTGRFQGDGGPAISASLNNPRDAVVSEGGELFISDSSNDRIRKVDLETGIITTYAGGGPGEATKFCVRPYTCNYNAPTLSGVPATLATLDAPNGIVLDPDGNLVIGDPGALVIRRVDARTGIITTIAGHEVFTAYYSPNGVPAHSVPMYGTAQLAYRPNGDLFFADYNNHQVRYIVGNHL